MKQYRTLLLIITVLFVGWTFLTVETCAQVKLTSLESDTVLYRIPVAHRTIPGQSGKYFMKYMGLENLMDSLDLKGTKIDSMTFASDTLKLYTNEGIFKVEILSGSTGTVTSVGLTTGTSGTDVNVTGSPITSSGSLTLNLPTSSSSNRGLLSSADWTTFNGKVGGSGSSGRVAFWSGANTVSSDANFLWDNTRMVFHPTTDVINIGRFTGSASQGANNINIGLYNGNGFGGSNANNVSIGNQNYWNSSTGINNVVIGRANYINSTGSYNVVIGDGNNSNGSGSNNLYIGRLVGVTAGSHYENVGLGFNVLSNATSAFRNVANGSYSLSSLTTGSENLGLGFYAGGAITTHSGCVGVGSYAIGIANGGNNNTALGTYAASNNTGNEIVAIGSSSARYQGQRTVAIGAGAGGGVSAVGNSNIFLGWSAGNGETGSNRLHITNSNTTANGIYGDFANSRFGVNQAPSSLTNTFDINGTLRVRTTNSVTPTTLMGRDANGVLAGLSLGSGIAITTGTLNFTETDGSITNEGYQGVTAGSATSSIIQGYNSAGTATGTGTTINAAGSISISETAATNGGQITLSGDYGAFTVAATTGGSGVVGPLDGDPFLTFTAGSGMTITRSGTTGDNQTLTFASTGGTTNLSYSLKSGTDVTLESSTGADVILRDGIGTFVNRVSANIIKYDVDEIYGQLSNTAIIGSATIDGVYRSVDFTVPDESFSSIIDAKTASDEIEVLVAGTYEIHYSLSYLVPSNRDVRWRIYKNTADIGYIGELTTYFTAGYPSKTFITTLAANDKISLRFLGVNGVSGTIDINSPVLKVRRIK